LHKLYTSVQDNEHKTSIYVYKLAYS